jgi:DNA-binding NarL/FixJ family response regulator
LCRLSKVADFTDAGFPFAEPLMAKQILIADDHEAVREGLRALLRAYSSWEICDATDGQEAVAKATELRPDLIILDYAMPGLDGLSAAKQIHELLPTVPIVLHTLYASTELNLAANKYGIRRVVDKKSGALISAVEELLSTAQP